jgi:hypothetical protein
MYRYIDRNKKTTNNEYALDTRTLIFEIGEGSSYHTAEQLMSFGGPRTSPKLQGTCMGTLYLTFGYRCLLVHALLVKPLDQLQQLLPTILLVRGVFCT